MIDIKPPHDEATEREIAWAAVRLAEQRRVALRNVQREIAAFRIATHPVSVGALLDRIEAIIEPLDVVRTYRLDGGAP